MTTHELKTWPVPFEAIKQNRKTFEMRKDDRDFATGDWLYLREWAPSGGDVACGEGQYTGRTLRLQVSYIMRGPAFGLNEGWVVLALGDYAKPVAHEN
jgi:hypothetical protein